MRRSGVRFISPAPILIRVCCYESNSKPFLFGDDVTMDVNRFTQYIGAKDVTADVSGASKTILFADATKIEIKKAQRVSFTIFESLVVRAHVSDCACLPRSTTDLMSDSG